MDQLIIFRAFQGIGAGGLMSTAIAIVGDLFSPRERAKWQAHVGPCARSNPKTSPEHVFGPSPDPEYEAHMRRLGERMRREKRLEVEKHEV